MDAATRIRVLLALAALYLIWGSTYLGIRYALEGFPPFVMAGSRFVFAGLILGAIALLRGEKLPTLRQWRNAAVIGFLLAAMGNGLVVFAEQWVVSSLAALAVSCMPIFAAVFGYFFGRELTRLDAVAVLIGFVGVVLLNRDAGMGGIFHPGVIALIAAPVCWAFGSVWAQSLDLPKGFMLSASQMLAGGLILCGISLALGESWPTSLSATALAAWLYLIVFGSIIAYSSYLYLLQHTRPAVATSYAYVNPVVAVFLGIVIAGERIDAWGWTGMVVIVSAVLLIQLQRSLGKR